MKAAVLEKINFPLKIRKNIIFDSLFRGQVLIKVVYTGICQSQIQEIYNGRQNKRYIPHLLGHEATGIVLDKHKSVKKIKKGDKVILSWIKSKGIQSKNPVYFCKDTKKKINSGSVTTFSNYSIVSENRLIKLDKEISMKKGVILGCAFPTGSGMIINNTKLNKTKKICFVGLGGVGVSALLTAINYESKEIYAIDISKKRIEHLKKYLPKKIKFITISNKNFQKKIVHNYKDYFDYVIESSGKSEGIEFSLKILNKKGSLIFASHPNKKEKIKINPFELIKGKKIYGSWGGNVNYDKQKKIIFKFFKKIRNYDKIFLEKEYNLQKINFAIQDLKQKKVLRPIVRLI